MGIIIPKNKEVTTWQGLHLFHFGMSNCSQRIRIMLEEKQLSWTSHHLDLAKDEHVTPWYQGINPKGVVPTLIHDGTVVVESVDILAYLDEQFPNKRLMRHEDIDQQQLGGILTLADQVQRSLKVLSHEFLFKIAAKKNAKDLQHFKEAHNDKDLVAFHAQFSSKAGLPQKKIQEAICEMHMAFNSLEQSLARHQYLAGEHFSIADITWIVNIHRMNLMNFPFSNYPHLTAWKKSMQSRPSYKKALVAYEPLAIRGFFRVYSFLRARLGRNRFDLARCA